MHCACLALQVRFAVMAWKAQKKIGSCSAVDFFYRNLLAIDAGLTGCETSVFRGERDVSRHKKKERVWLGVRALSSSLFFFPLSYFVQRLQYPNAWNRLCRHGQRAVGLLEDMSSFLCPAGWVLRMISSDRDDRGIFGGLKFSISGFFWVGKFCQVFFSLGSLI